MEFTRVLKSEEINALSSADLSEYMAWLATYKKELLTKLGKHKEDMRKTNNQRIEHEQAQLAVVEKQRIAEVRQFLHEYLMS